MNIFLEKLTAVVETNLTNNQFGVSELAKEMNMSRSSLHRKVKKAAGLTVSQFICQIRLKKASILLQQESSTISNTAFDCGFQSVSYFNKCFKDFYGFSPGKINKKSNRRTILSFLKSRSHKRSKGLLNIGKPIFVFLLLVLIAFIINSHFSRSEKENLRDKSIGIHSFNYIGNDPDKQYLALGMTEAILHHLSKIKDLKVIPCYSMDNYTGTDKEIISIGKKLDIAFLLEGSYQKTNEKINVNLRLISTRDGNQIWSNEYLYHQTDIFPLQIEIAQKIAEELNVVITPVEKRKIENIPTFSLTAYDFYMRGREEFRTHQMNNVNNEALEKAEMYYRQALQQDPDYAQAYAGLALVYKNKNRGKEYFTEAFLDSMLYLANKALSFNEDNAEAHYVKGMYYWYSGHRDKSLNEYNKALKLNPNLWEAYRGKGTLFLVNDPLKSIINYNKAATLTEGENLKLVLKEMFMAYLWAGFIPEAKKCNMEALQLSGDSLMYYTGLGAIESQMGHANKAIEYYQKAYAIDSSYFSVVWFYHDITRQLGFNYLLAGDYKHSLKYFRKWISILEQKGEISFNGMHRVALALWENGYEEEAEYYFNLQMEYCNNLINSNNWWAQAYFAYYDRAALYAFKGNEEKCYQDLAVFTEILRPPMWMVNLIKQDPLFKSIRNEARFQQIITDIEAKYTKEHEHIAMMLQ